MAKSPVELTDEIVDNAYHGTDLATADRLAAGETFLESKGPNHWLGNGAYFFQGSFGMAVFWAKAKAEETKSAEYGVLRASIILGRCLDLTIPKYRKQLGKWVGLLKAKAKLTLTRAWIINSFARKYRGGFDTVRCRFPPGLPNEPPSCSERSKKAHVQISVLTMQNITKVSRVRKGRR